MYVGFQICQEDRGIILDQSDYVTDMKKRPFSVDECCKRGRKYPGL